MLTKLSFPPACWPMSHRKLPKMSTYYVTEVSTEFVVGNVSLLTPHMDLKYEGSNVEGKCEVLAACW